MLHSAYQTEILNVKFPLEKSIETLQENVDRKSWKTDQMFPKAKQCWEKKRKKKRKGFEMKHHIKQQQSALQTRGRNWSFPNFLKRIVW